MAPQEQPIRVIGGRYRLVGELGSGGFGKVWSARDDTLHVDVAVKEVQLPDSASDVERAKILSYAKQEASNAAQLRDHPNIVAVHDVILENGIPWIIMRLVDGCSLKEHLDAHGPLSVEKTALVATAVLRALSAAHAAGIVHRDIKPANVMLTSNGHVLVSDFGIAVRQADTVVTTPGAVTGSLEYIAPERIHGDNRRAASDLFSLGVTLYEAVEDTSPFRRGTPSGTLSAILSDDPPPPEHAERLTGLIMRLLDKNPDQRPTIPQALALIDAVPPSVAEYSRLPPATATAAFGVLAPHARELAVEYSPTLASGKSGAGNRVREEDILTVTSMNEAVAKGAPVSQAEVRPARAKRIRKLLKLLRHEAIWGPVAIVAFVAVFGAALFANARFVAVPVGVATAHAFFNMCVSDGASSLVTKVISAVFGLIVGSALFGIPFYVLRIGASLIDH